VNSFAPTFRLSAGPTPSVEYFSPSSAFHASSEAAFSNLLDLTLTMILHTISPVIKKDDIYPPDARRVYLLPFVMTSPVCIGSAHILLSNPNMQMIHNGRWQVKQAASAWIKPAFGGLGVICFLPLRSVTTVREGRETMDEGRGTRDEGRETRDASILYPASSIRIGPMPELP
jgi:hypothetical protein